jgi:rhomboid protease GluP
MSNESDIFLRVTDDERLAHEWELVLLAQGLSPSLRRNQSVVTLSVPEGELERAHASLLAYESENHEEFAGGHEPAISAICAGASVLTGILILVFFTVTVVSNSTMLWFERGSADAHKISNGEIWRTVTALTLHADIAHAASNAAAIAVFFGAASSMLGVGLGGALILMAGAGANLANAFLQGSPHVSVGASTSVFGAVGLLGGVGAIVRGRRALSGRRAWLPIAAALALFGMLGTGGERVDVGAHLLGLLVGSVLGIVIAFVAPRPLGFRIQWTCGGAAVAVLIYCWILALC